MTAGEGGCESSDKDDRSFLDVLKECEYCSVRACKLISPALDSFSFGSDRDVEGEQPVASAGASTGSRQFLSSVSPVKLGDEIPKLLESRTVLEHA